MFLSYTFCMNTETQTDSNITNNKDQRNIFISLIVLVVVACIVVFELVRGGDPAVSEVSLIEDDSVIPYQRDPREYNPENWHTSSALTMYEAERIAEQYCIKGGEALGMGTYNESTRTWWFDANLNATREGCNPACVVSEDTRTAEINWRCNGARIPEQDPYEEMPPYGVPQDIEPTNPIACTMDAKICPDGSAVGRTAPNCEFAPCPTSDDSGVIEVGLNETVFKNGLSIRPVDIVEDSRCPIDAQCIQAGTVRVGVELEFGKEVEYGVFEVGVPVEVANDTLILTLKDVFPSPQVARNVSLSEYEFTFLVLSGSE